MSVLALARAPVVEETPAMAQGLVGFVGREAERAHLGDALAAARDGRGATWLLAGEAGIGKSRLLEEVAREAEQAGFLVLWGRCWEAGGAPAFWPWIQVVREALRHAEATLLGAGRGAHLLQLVPELRDRVPEPPPPGDGAQFALLDSVATGLVAIARERPLFVALEDLHGATPSSLLLLDFLAQQVRTAPILILGTYRPIDPQDGETGALLQRVAQTARTLALAPLPREAIAELLAAATGTPPPDALVETVADRTEGNPLFLVELCRVMIARRGEAPPADAVPPTLRSALQRHVAVVAPAVREILEHAAVLGRDFALARLVGAFGLRREDVEGAIADAERAAIVARAATEGTYRFTHMLLREVLHQELPPSRRQALHLQVARWLETYSAERAVLPWSEIAHHYFAAGEDARESAIDATEAAALQATQTLAFAEAIASYRAALQAVDLAPVRSTRRRAELMIGLGHAQLRCGEARTGRDTCLAAAALARELGAPELLARAALELGSMLTFAKIDPMLVALLEEALRTLGTGHDRLRARVMSRLAAALQPAEHPREPIALALEAVALARTTGDPQTLLATLGSASSAMVDNVEASERLPLDREHVALAASLDDPVEQLRGQIRIALGSFEVGDLTAALTAIAAIHALGDRLSHPFYAWRVTAIDAMVALWEGRFGDAEALIERARALGVAGGDPNVHAAVAYQTARLARLTGRREALRDASVRLCALFTGTPIAETLGRVAAAAAALQLGAPVGVTAAELVAARNDRASFEPAAEVALALGERGFAERLYTALAGDLSRCVSSGVVGLTWDAPLARVRALLERTLGRRDDAIASMTAALAACRALGGRPMLAWTAQELAAWLVERGAPADLATAAQLREEAETIARELGMHSVLARLDEAAPPRPASPAPVPPPKAPRPPTEPLAITRSGELWRVTHGGTSLHLRDGKGIRYLARLVAEPGRELHVLDLADALDAVDTGDAGELLDPRARDHYRARVQALEESLADAEQRHDLGAAERAMTELEFLQAELGRAIGLGGRARRGGAAVERARINVQRRLRSAITQLASHDAALARHLERAVRTGVYCCYEPE